MTEEYARGYFNKQTQMTKLLLDLQATADRQGSLLEDALLPPGKFTVEYALDEWLDKYNKWYKNSRKEAIGESVGWLNLLERCGHALASLDNSYPNELDIIDASLLDELVKELS